MLENLQPYNTKGEEIIPRYCPFCKGGKNGDKDTFALNITKETYNCLRGSCGEQGHISQLYKHFGLEYEEKKIEVHRKKNTYKQPKPIKGELTQASIDYANLRKISTATLEKIGVKVEGNNYVFDYTEGGKLVFRKFRPIGKIKEGQKKAWRENGGKVILWNIDKIDIKKPVVIVEGEFDLLAVVEAGYDNVISVPSGTNDLGWIDNCWEWIKSVEEFILFGDQDEPGIEMMEIITDKIGEEKVRIASINKEHIEILDSKKTKTDANALLYEFGKEAILKPIKTAKYIDKEGILELADIKMDQETKKGIPTGIRPLDRKYEDMQLGELTIWTGEAGSGKSTILSQIMLESVEHNYKTFVFSGELTKMKFKTWLTKQAAGSDNLVEYANHYGDMKHKVKEDALIKMDGWLRGKFYLLDNRVLQKEGVTIESLVRYAIKRYNCQSIVIDNLMTADFLRYQGNDFNNKQTAFVKAIKEITNDYPVHINLVAHPKKKDGEIGQYDIAGSSNITNLADNIILIKRVEEEEHHAEIHIKKNRNTGELGKVRLNFDSKNKLFYALNPDGTPPPIKKYSWQKINNSYGQEVYIKQSEIPF